ncbi:uncharacterized protein LOC126833893 [Adelges cooleyi]|uniref:uncharacterized protein LOC126833893 n=1 Tax=Adelges cooleyi TaxID=133065 RepID=UPI00217F9A39|nr:uncharacterized protein LOC126833893 [Adelges cooleyi]
MFTSSNNLSAQFQQAVSFISGSNISDFDIQLKLYGFYKQALEGKCNQPKPPIYNLKGRKKWYAWSEMGAISKEEAMEQYIELVKTINPNFQSVKTGWVSVSTLANKEKPISENEKTISDWVKEGNLDKISTYKHNINIIDEMGMAPIHWASDRGNLTVLMFLVENLSADVNLQDDMGQTALHYAISCNHKDVSKYLVDKGARTDIPDDDGVTVIQMCANSKFSSILLQS